MMAAPEHMGDNIRKFEEIGTHPAAPYLAIAEALTFHQCITSPNRAFSCCLGTVQVQGIDPGELSDHLWRKHKIIAAPIMHAEFSGIRVTPNVYTMLEEIDRFGDAAEEVILYGLPG